MTERDELEIINRIRGEISSNQEPTGENLFLARGYPTAIVLFIEFLALLSGTSFGASGSGWVFPSLAHRR